MSDMSDCDQQSQAPPTKKTRSRKGVVNKYKIASAITAKERVHDFPNGIFVVREGSEGMWCTYCGVEVQVCHKNFGLKHLDSAKHKRFANAGLKAFGSLEQMPVIKEEAQSSEQVVSHVSSTPTQRTISASFFP